MNILPPPEKSCFVFHTSQGRGNSNVLFIVALLLFLTQSCEKILFPSVSADVAAATVQENPAPWEQQIGAVYENKGIAKIEKVGVRYVLTTYCQGIHSIYAKASTEVQLNDYEGKFVQVRYKYIEEINTNIQCVTAPCEPVAEKIALIVALTAVEVSEGERMNYQTSCSNLIPANR